MRVHKKGSGAVPLTLVETAINLQSQNGDIDEYWCLYDVEAPDPHPNLDRARDLAQAHQIRTAVSNPCFEIWFLLHFKAHTRWESTDDAIKLREQEDGSTGKEVDGALYMPERWTAVANARDLRDKHIDDQTVFPHDNPSSGVFELLVAVEGRTS